MELVLTIATILVALPYVLGPVLLWMNGSHLPPTRMEQAGGDAKLPPAVESHLWKTTAFFSSNGFEMLGARVRESASNGFSSYKQAWRNPETAEVALAGAFLKADDASFCNTFVAFLHDRANGAMVMTSNFNAGARTLLDPPGSSKISVDNQDLAELRAIHQGHLAVVGSETVRPVRFRDGFALCKQLDDATRQRAVDTKRFRA
ncbi:MAG TPA: hypothetical protein VJ717_07865, partial [Gemmatimonadaceae bacterium]|nr:hypothetical protein [Gemmatimonadaceae bacterium]